MTRKYGRIQALLFAIVIILTIVPLVASFAISLASGAIAEKSRVTLGVIFVGVLALTIVNLIAKWHWRTPMWLFLFAIIWLCNIKEVIVILFIMGGCTILDEIIFTPLYKCYRDKYKFNKNFDRRLRYERGIKGKDITEN